MCSPLETTARIADMQVLWGVCCGYTELTYVYIVVSAGWVGMSVIEGAR